MIASLLVFAKWMPGIIGIAGISFAAYNWFAFFTLTRQVTARYCGNVAIGTFVLSPEIALLGVALIACSVSNLRWRHHMWSAWLLAIVGLLFSAILYGFPVFVSGYVLILCDLAEARREAIQ